MFDRIKRRLEWKLLSYFLLSMIGFSAIMAAYTYYNTGQRRSSEMSLYDTHGRTLIRSFAADVVFGLLSMDAETLSERVDALFEDPTVSYALIYNDAGEEVYARYRERVKPGLIELSRPSPGDTAGVSVNQVAPSAGVAYLDFTAPVEVSGAAAFSGEDSSGIGWARIGMSLDTLNREIAGAWAAGAFLIAAVVAGGVVFVWFSMRTIMSPVERLAEASRLVGEGEFGVQVEVSSQDQIGLLADTFNRMSANIKEQTGRMEELISNIAQAVKLLTDTVSHLLSVTSQQSAGATEQASVVEQVVTTTEEISATADKITETAEQVRESAEKTSQAANRGSEYLESSISGMERVRNQVEQTTGQIMSMAEQAQQIGGIIDIIEEISEQTNLLALNASIEAVGASEAGKRFAVVANEVRRLANRSLEATESVRKMVESIRNATNTAVMLSENQQKAVEDGARSVKAMGEHFAHILDLVESTRNSGAQIGIITRQQSTATQQMVSSMREVEGVTKEVEKGVKEIESSMQELSSLAERLKSLIEKKDAEENPQSRQATE